MARSKKGKARIIAFKMHCVFAHFEVPRSIYEKALQQWVHKRIRNQPLASLKLRLQKRNVLIRIFPNGKLSFVIGATENPVDYLWIVNVLYPRILSEIRVLDPAFEPGDYRVQITHCDLHVDSVGLPKLYPIIPRPNTFISIHQVRKRKPFVHHEYRIEVRGPVEDAVATLIDLLQVKRFTF